MAVNKNASDDDLMRAVARKDVSAFEELTARYHKKVFAFVWRLCLNANDAEDITQEVFLKVWRFAVKFDPKALFSTWLYKVAYNCFLDTRRRGLPVDDALPCPDDLPDTHSPEEDLEKSDVSATVLRAMEKLPARQREALVLCYYEDLTAKQACEMMNLSQGAVEMLLFRARQSLKETLSVLKKELSS